MNRQSNAIVSTDGINIDHLCADDLERAVLGALLLEDGKFPVLEEIIEIWCFFAPINGKVWELIKSVKSKNQKIDLLTVAAEAKSTQSDVPIPYLAQLTSCIGSGAHAEQHARQLRELATLRRLVQFGMSATAVAANGETAPTDLIDELHRQLDELSMGAGAKNNSKHISETVGKCFEQLESRQRMAQSGQTVGIPTGLTSLDNATAGWQGGQLVVLAGRPAMGKSAVMLHFANAAAMAGKAVCIYSLEMPDVQLVGRILVGEAGVNNTAYRLGRLQSEEWSKLERTGSEIAKRNIFLNDTADITIGQISQEAKMMHRKGKCDLLMIDYLQLIKSTSRSQTREREVAEMSRKAKVLAKSLNIPVILLAQLSRKVEERADRTPILSDLRESGAIEQDADLVVFIDRPEQYGTEFISTSFGEISTKGAGRLIVAKNREGMTGDCWFRHDGQMTRIWNYNDTPQNQDETEAF